MTRRSEYDIVNDPRYDSTPVSQSLVVSRSPSIISYSRKKLLRLIGLPHDATWDQANPILKQRLVAARAAGDSEAAVKWSNIRDELEGKLCHYCDCGELIRTEFIRCQACSSREIGLNLREPGWWRKNETFRSQLGKRSDTYLARRWKMGRSSVSYIRQKYGIPAYDCFRGEDDGDRTTQRRHWPAEVIAKLGTVLDTEITRIYGYPTRSVMRERRLRGIPAFLKKTFHKLSRRHVGMLGQMSDVDLAARAKVPVKTVGYFRRKAGITAFNRFRPAP